MYAHLSSEIAVPVDKETHCFRLVAHLDNVTKDTLEEKTENDDIVVKIRLLLL